VLALRTNTDLPSTTTWSGLLEVGSEQAQSVSAQHAALSARTAVIAQQ
jgi:hypothetical protein